MTDEDLDNEEQHESELFGRVEVEYKGVMTDLRNLPQQDYERFLKMMQRVTSLYSTLKQRRTNE